MALNRVILFGRIVRDPEYRQTTSGTAVCRFSVACDRQFADKQTGKREADFIECTAWRNTAEFVSRYFQKGSAITVEGSLRNNNFEDKNGVKHNSYVVVADNVGFGGSKSENGGQQQGNYQSAYPQAGQQQNSAQPDFGEYEEVLNDGEIPF